MSPRNIIRSWKDPEYRLSLSEAEREQLPAHPAGLIELTDTDLYSIAGGSGGNGAFENNANASGTTCLGCTNAVKCC